MAEGRSSPLKDSNKKLRLISLPMHLTEPILVSVSSEPPLQSFYGKPTLDEGLSLQEIAAETVSSWKTVRRHILYSSIPLKAKDRLINEQIRFGFKRVDGKLESDSAEQQAVDTILRMRRNGKTLRQIVDNLNLSNIPARKIGGRWHLKTVHKIISSNYD